MPVKDLLRLGNPLLYQPCSPVQQHELPQMDGVVGDLHDTLMDFRSTWGPARAVAAPQIGVMKRLIYMHINEPVVFINPILDEFSDAMLTLWDDCMSFPELLVKVQRHCSCRISYRDMNWKQCRADLTDLAELLEHEVDHLDGILALSRAIDDQSIILRSEREFVDGPLANN